MTRLILALMLVPALAHALPRGFSYLRDIDPTIQQDIRYAADKNFTGAFVPGYLAGECVLKTPVAVALKKVQRDLKKRGYSLKVYDCYRPQKAVSFFVAWVKDPHAPDFANQFYPREQKRNLIRNGYIAAKSGHSKGNTLDLTIVPLNTEQPPIQAMRTYDRCIGESDNKLPDNSLDMGTGFDCFDIFSHTKSSKVNRSAQKNRKLLVNTMSHHGFKNYSKEWWHYRYTKISSGSTYYNFDILPRALFVTNPE